MTSYSQLLWRHLRRRGSLRLHSLQTSSHTALCQSTSHSSANISLMIIIIIIILIINSSISSSVMSVTGWAWQRRLLRQLSPPLHICPTALCYSNNICSCIIIIIIVIVIMSSISWWRQWLWTRYSGHVTARWRHVSQLTASHLVSFSNLFLFLLIWSRSVRATIVNIYYWANESTAQCRDRSCCHDIVCCPDNELGSVSVCTVCTVCGRRQSTVKSTASCNYTATYMIRLAGRQSQMSTYHALVASANAVLCLPETFSGCIVHIDISWLWKQQAVTSEQKVLFEIVFLSACRQN